MYSMSRLNVDCSISFKSSASGVSFFVKVLPHSVSGQMVYTVRQRCGRQLAFEAPTDADLVSTVPESATPAALGYAQQVTSLLLIHNKQVFSHGLG